MYNLTSVYIYFVLTIKFSNIINPQTFQSIDFNSSYNAIHPDVIL